MKKQVGRKPFGYYSDEANTLEVIGIKRRPRRGSGGKKTSAYRIAIELNDQGFTTQKGKKFKTQTVCDILRRLENISKPKARRKYAKKEQLEAGDYRTPDQVRADRVKLAAFPKLLAVYDILVGTGMRAGEFCSLRVKDVDIEKKLVSIAHGKNTKDRTIGKRRVISAAPRSIGALAEMIADKGKRPAKLAAIVVNSKGQPLSYKALLYLVKKMAKIIGVDGFHPHVLRHTFGTVLYNLKKDLFFVAQQMGHMSVETTRVYAKCWDSSKLQQMDEFEGMLFSDIGPSGG